MYLNFNEKETMRRAMLGRKEKDTGKGINGENAGKLEKQK